MSRRLHVSNFEFIKLLQYADLFIMGEYYIYNIHAILILKRLSSSPLPFIVMMVACIPLSLSALPKVLLILAVSQTDC